MIALKELLIWFINCKNIFVHNIHFQNEMPHALAAGSNASIKSVNSSITGFPSSKILSISNLDGSSCNYWAIGPTFLTIVPTPAIHLPKLNSPYNGEAKRSSSFRIV